MIGFNSFVKSVHQAVSDAADVVADKNRELLDRYFTATQQVDGTEVLIPRMVTLTVPDVDDEGNAVSRTVSVPLVSLMPFTSSKIERATFSAEFRLSIEDGELQLSFPGEKLPKDQSTLGRLEITISPDESPEGLQRLIDTYAEVISKQL